MIGKPIAHYMVTEKLGEGGMGEVYRATDTTLGRDVALKVLPAALTSDAGRIRRFEREAKTLASLEHPNIATVYGFHEQDGVHVLAMEFVEGDTLASSVVEDGLPLRRLLDIGIPLAEAMSFAHDRGVVHRDLKPANLMLDASGRLRVLDFGVAALRSASADEEAGATLDESTATSGAVGTVAYMAPEQLEGRVVDARADVFAIGIVLWELAAGRHPFRSNSLAGTASSILRDDVAPLRGLRPDLPAELDRLLQRCLRKDPDRRIQTARDIRNELEDLRTGIGAEDPPAGTPAMQVTERSMRITIEHVRALAAGVPRMVGDSMTYLDNGRESDTLVIYLPGIGFDQREFQELLQVTPFRCVAPSLYGLGPTAALRPAISFADHNQLIAFLIEEIRRRIAPRTVVIAGMSSGADQMLRILSDDAERVRTDGVVLLGCAVRAEDAPVAKVYAELSDDPTELLETIRMLAATADDLDSWLYVHEYLVGAFGKLGTDVAALREFSRGYAESCRADENLPRLRSVLQRARCVRLVFAEDEREVADFVLERHIRDNALGDRFTEDVIVPDAARRHSQLRATSVLLPLVEEVARLAAADADAGPRG